MGCWKCLDMSGNAEGFQPAEGFQRLNVSWILADGCLSIQLSCGVLGFGQLVAWHCRNSARGGSRLRTLAEAPQLPDGT